MRAEKLREMTRDELLLEEAKLIEQIFRLRFQIAASQAENPAKVHVLRKDLARVKTVLGQKAREKSVVSRSEEKSDGQSR